MSALIIRIVIRLILRCVLMTCDHVTRMSIVFMNKFDQMNMLNLIRHWKKLVTVIASVTSQFDCTKSDFTGAPTFRGCRDTILLNFPKNCMKLRKIRSLGAGPILASSLHFHAVFGKNWANSRLATTFSPSVRMGMGADARSQPQVLRLKNWPI